MGLGTAMGGSPTVMIIIIVLRVREVTVTATAATTNNLTARATTATKLFSYFRFLTLFTMVRSALRATAQLQRTRPDRTYGVARGVADCLLELNLV